jgi:toxin ParE1/3/4
MSAKYSLFISDEAYFDILDAFLWYEALRDGLGKDFELCLEAKFNQLVKNPELFQVKYKEIRVAFTERFPFGIHYLMQDNTVKVIAVFHTARDPQNWEDRL